MKLERACSGADFIEAESPLILSSKQIMGINLGFDFCTEHECGIANIRRAFRIDGKELGFEGKRNTSVPENLVIRHYAESSVMVFENFWNGIDKQIESILKHDLYFLNKESELASAWDEKSFGVHVRKQYAETLDSLFDSFKTKNGIIMLSGNSSPFANSGLILADYRRIPVDVKQDFWRKDKSYREEQAMFRKLEEESGVYAVLKKAGKAFFSLHIKRLDDKGSPKWLLNPQKQHSYNFGWFTTEDLLQWAQDKGPVLKKKKE